MLRSVESQLNTLNRDSKSSLGKMLCFHLFKLLFHYSNFGNLKKKVLTFFTFKPHSRMTRKWELLQLQYRRRVVSGQWTTVEHFPDLHHPWQYLSLLSLEAALRLSENFVRAWLITTHFPCFVYSTFRYVYLQVASCKTQHYCPFYRANEE